MGFCGYNTILDIDVKDNHPKFLPLAILLGLFTYIDLFFAGVTGAMKREGIFFAVWT